ncbi:MAG TPA: class D sortase [Candidatus Sulfotelmatobacter sp.]
MLANLTDVIAEADGSDEFREILHVLVQEKQEHGFSLVGSTTKRWRVIRIRVERVLLISGLALLAVYATARLESLLSSRADLQQFAAIAPSSASAGREVAEDIGTSAVDFSLWDEHRVQAYKKRTLRPPRAPLAVLHILKIGLEVPLLDGTDGLTLNHAVGRISGTARPGEPGNIGIAGHRDGFFRGLKDIGIGDTIELKTPQGTDTYAVDELNIVSPSETDVLRAGLVPSLTLVTCYPFHFIGSAPQRYIVHASRTELNQRSPIQTEQGSLILANENKEKAQ